MKKVRLLLPILLVALVHSAAAKDAEPSATPGRSDEKFDLQRQLQDGRLLYAPYPVYSYEARRLHQVGSGIARLKVDPETGNVAEATMQLSTGSAILDNATLRALRLWKFKPHTVSAAKIPVTYTLLGALFTYKKDEHPLAEMLAPFLGAGAVRKAKVPEYPDRQHWSFKHGKGRYEIHVGAGGRVENVAVLQSSGDPVFDNAAVKTLGKWELNRGPLVVELPLSFILTPNSYRVDIAR